MRILATIGVGIALLGTGSNARAEAPLTQVGVAVVDITPDYPIRLNGYGNRKTEATEVESRLKVRAIAIGSDAEHPVVLVAVDNCAVPGFVADDVAARLKVAAKLPRERFVVCSTHTHCAPCVGKTIPFIFGGPMPAEFQEHINRYTQDLAKAMESSAIQALADRRPARLAWAKGEVKFAANRRVLNPDGQWKGFGVNPAGPVDHSLPVLRATAPDGTVRAVLVGYACHCTTLDGNFNKVSAEWAGYACDAIETAHPGATALVIIGCGADANPEPRKNITDAKTHGTSVAQEVERLLSLPMTALAGTITTTYRQISLPFAPVPTREQFVERTKRKGAEGYFASVMLERLDKGERLPADLMYPVQVWAFQDALAMVFLGGEVVVDYALRLNRECDAKRLWVVAYSNDVPCYIASKRVIAEGGYEVDGSMTFYGRPTRFAPEVEDRLIEGVHSLLPDTFEKPAQ